MPETPTQTHNLVAANYALATHPADAQVEDSAPADFADDAGCCAKQLGSKEREGRSGGECKRGILRLPADRASEGRFGRVRYNGRLMWRMLLDSLKCLE